MIMKKLLAIALASAMVLSLAACGSSTGTTTESASAETTVAETTLSAETDGTSIVTTTAEAGTPAAELAELFNTYTMGCMTGGADGATVLNFYNDDHTDFKQAVFTVTDDQSSALFDLDMMAEDYYQQFYDILAVCEDIAITTPDLPDMTEYEAMAGKTIGELEDAGFDLCTYSEDENGKEVVDFYVYPDVDTTYTLRVIPDIAEDDDTFYDDESIKDLTAKEIIFWEFD